MDPKFDLSEGAGTPLGKLPCFTTVKRGKATKDLEAAIEPLHRLVYGRPGQTGERKLNLEDFKGFPSAMEEEVKEKLTNLTKDKLRAMILALGMRVLISQTHAQVVEGVLAFLMRPKDEGKIKPEKPTGTKKRTRSASAGATGRTATTAEDGDDDDDDDAEESEEPSQRDKTEAAPAAKKARKEVAATPAKATEASSTKGPSEDAVRVQVYRRVLAMAPEERAVLGVKQLRTAMEAHFKLPEGELKKHKDLIAETASDCVRALMEAEARARAASPAAPSEAAAARAPTEENTEATEKGKSATEDNASPGDTVPDHVTDTVPPPL